MKRFIYMFKKMDWKELYCMFSHSMFIFILEMSIYKIIKTNDVGSYWIFIPIFIYVVELILSKYIKNIHTVGISLELSNIFSFLLLIIGICTEPIQKLLWDYFEVVAVIIMLAFLINLFVSKDEEYITAKDITTVKNPQLFNLFYLNTSKAHEIAMLIDNKIMKTIEQEQVSEELLKYSVFTKLGSKNIGSTEAGYSAEDNSKKRVYENFDVKTTKSIMLRTIYEVAQKKNANKEKLEIGDLALFKNIELQQRNIDDTVTILNILRDSKIKNQKNENVEINIGKMMDKILEDFTIDYLFSLHDAEQNTCSSEKKYIIQIPYKSTANFENGYQHNDLQLGKLSLIGIYRGEIDFSKRESISSRFLEMVSESYNQEGKTNAPIDRMKVSSQNIENNNNPFEFNHKKLLDKMELVDVIAIIQELNFGGDE